jgi:hypothetical protein
MWALPVVGEGKLSCTWQLQERRALETISSKFTNMNENDGCDAYLDARDNIDHAFPSKHAAAPLGR